MERWEGRGATGIRPELARSVVRSFFRIKWGQRYGYYGGTPLRLLVLEGTTRYLDRGAAFGETAWLNVHTSPACNENQSVPVIPSEGKLGRRYYVYHEGAVQVQRQTIANHISLQYAPCDPKKQYNCGNPDPDLIVDEMDTMSGTIKDLLFQQTVRPGWDRNRGIPEWSVTPESGGKNNLQNEKPEYPM